MARLIWTEKALADLNEISEYIAFENPGSARRLTKRVFQHADMLKMHPLMGPVIPEFQAGSYRQISERPCRLIYRYDGENVVILRVIRTEQLLRFSQIEEDE
jgi:toxin ParE1/3/4